MAREPNARRPPGCSRKRAVRPLAIALRETTRELLDFCPRFRPRPRRSSRTCLSPGASSTWSSPTFNLIVGSNRASASARGRGRQGALDDGAGLRASSLKYGFDAAEFRPCHRRRKNPARTFSRSGPSKLDLFGEDEGDEIEQLRERILAAEPSEEASKLAKK